MSGSIELVDLMTDLKECERFVKELGYESTYIVRDMLKAVGAKAKAKARTYYRRGYTSRTGTLYGAIKWHFFQNDKNSIYIDSNARNPKNGVKYAYVLASGHRVKSKRDAKAYTATTGLNKWTDTGNVIKFKKDYDFIDKPVNTYLKSEKYKSDLDKALDKKVAKIEKKLGITHEQ